MSVHQLQAYQDKASELMKKFDKNGDGVLTKDELTEFFLHVARRSTPKDDYNVANAHTRPNSRLRDKAQKSPTKVLNGKTSNMPISREQMKEIFRYHDGDKDGFLNVRELTKAFGFLGSIIPFYKAYYGLAHADTDRDGLISETELEKLIDYANKVSRKK